MYFFLFRFQFAVFGPDRELDGYRVAPLHRMEAGEDEPLVGD